MKASFRPFFVLLLLLPPAAWGQQVTFARVMELADQHGSQSAAAAEVSRAQAAIRETKSYYLPQLVIGSGLGKSFGYPVSIEGAAPSVVQINYSSFLYNPAQRQFIHSAQQAWLGAQAGLKDQRSASLLEAALDYIQLDNDSTRAAQLRSQQDDADRLVQIEKERVQAGVDPAIELTRAQLQAARVRMNSDGLAGQADVLRARLSQLTGLPANELETVSDSIPNVPDISTEKGIIADALANNPAIKSAEQQAKAALLQAKGEHKALLPAVDAVASYGYFTRYNNYDLYFSRFQNNNATVGVAIRFQFLNFPQRARAAEADASAVKAQRDADSAKNKVSAETLRLARSVRQLASANEVARLEYQLAQDEANALQTRLLAAAPGTQNQPAPSPRDLQAARIQVGDKYAAYLDATFAVQKAKLELLRSAGKLEDWVSGKATP